MPTHSKTRPLQHMYVAINEYYFCCYIYIYSRQLIYLPVLDPFYFCCYFILFIFFCRAFNLILCECMRLFVI